MTHAYTQSHTQTAVISPGSRSKPAEGGICPSPCLTQMSNESATVRLEEEEEVVWGGEVDFLTEMFVSSCLIDGETSPPV